MVDGGAFEGQSRGSTTRGSREMLTSILISALTCLAMAWLPVHHFLPTKGVPNAETQAQQKQVPARFLGDGFSVAQKEFPRRSDARRNPPVS